MILREITFIYALAATALPVSAADYTVKMITDHNAAQVYRFEPSQLSIMPGDTVHFVDAQDDRHDVMFEAIPKGASFVASPMLEKEGQTWSYTFTTQGTYQYHCHPHEELGMRGVIIVGKASRPEEMLKEEEDEMPGMDHMAMRGVYGRYPMTREASGTAWIPDSSPMGGLHGKAGDWETMAHGYANVVYDRQGGKRGDSKAFSESMAMLMASRPLGPGTFRLRGMFSLDPAMGKNGYPLLLQTGETANGVEPLIDHQHPHDLFMELAALYSVPAGPDSSIFGYFGYPGEPALGPATFMHRFSGADNPEAPIGHHWLDSTHISYGVISAGFIRKNWKLEASAFNGREPDQFRWNFDTLRLNSYSARLTWNPGDDWSLQISRGIIKSPEALSSEVAQKRTTASISYNHPKGRDNWQTTLAWGQDDNDPGHATTALLLESAFTLRTIHTFFGRVEYIGKDELFQPPSPQAGRVFYVGKLSIGYIYDIAVSEYLKLGIGGLGSVYALPSAVESAYGHDPVSGMIFARMKL